MARLNYPVLQAELLAGHPVTGPYNADDQLAADELNAKNITVDRDFIPTTELFEIVLANKAEWDALTADDRQTVRDILVIHSAEGIPTDAGSNARAVLIATLGATTRAAVGAAIPESVSRASQLDLNYAGDLTVSHVAGARAL